MERIKYIYDSVWYIVDFLKVSFFFLSFYILHAFIEPPTNVLDIVHSLGTQRVKTELSLQSSPRLSG